MFKSDSVSTRAPKGSSRKGIKMCQLPVTKHSPQQLKLKALITSALILLVLIIHTAKAGKKDIYRKSIVFDMKTPKVFYCPQEKQSDKSKTIVKARALEKLCEYGGEPKPKNAPTDCYNDTDESEFACEEKRRFMLRLNSPQEQML